MHLPNSFDLCITDNVPHFLRRCSHWHLEGLQVFLDLKKRRLQSMQPHAQVELVHPIIWSLFIAYQNTLEHVNCTIKHVPITNLEKRIKEWENGCFIVHDVELEL